MMARVSVPFTEGHYCDRGERPNTELAHNSPSVCRKKSLCMSMIRFAQQEEQLQSLQTIFRKEESNRSSRHTKPKRARSNQIVHRILQTKATSYTLISIYKETNGELGPFLKLCKLMKENDVSVEKVVNAVDINIHKLPYMEELYGQVKMK